MSGQKRTPLPYWGKGQQGSVAGPSAPAAAFASGAPAVPAVPSAAAGPAAPAASASASATASAAPVAPVPAPATFACPACGRTFTRQKGVEKHSANTHVGTVCQVPGCSHTTATEAGMKAHLQGHQRSHQVPAGAVQGGRRYLCAWPCCVRAFTRAWDAHTCFGQHQADAFAATRGAAPAPAPAQQQN
ncbi:hypothetical protein PG993_003201 [Apiospora rasikravindrae]|uniref:C2H2-type domain-containing protein n=1 Tax=Apiospora rasikravindrae TaxID=990691 RepID=A0ABR1U109_9PEZI